nr:unnamed protein product [Digitaria exilis]
MCSVSGSASKESPVPGCDCRCSTPTTTEPCKSPTGHYMSQVPMFPPRTPLTPQQMQEQQQQQLQQQQAQALAFPGQMVMRPATVNGMQPMQADPAASLQQSASVPADGRGGKQDATAGVNTEPSGTESLKNTTGADHEAGGDAADKS